MEVNKINQFILWRRSHDCTIAIFQHVLLNIQAHPSPLLYFFLYVISSCLQAQLLYIFGRRETERWASSNRLAQRLIVRIPNVPLHFVVFAHFCRMREHTRDLLQNMLLLCFLKSPVGANRFGR